MNLFEKYGRFCAHYSLEVMVCFFTMFVGSVSLNLRSPYEFCQWSFQCNREERELATQASSDAVLLSILRCSTIIYFFVKLRKISQLGSGYVVGGVCVCITFSSMAFAAILVQILQKDWTIVGDALPIFLLHIDLSRMVILIKHTLTAISINAVESHIAEAMKKIGPVVTLDTFIEVLVIIMCSTMKVRQLQDIFCFACLSVLLNCLIFTTLVPSCLTVFLIVSQKHSLAGTPPWYDLRFAKVLEKEWNQETNPRVYRLKIIMCCVLLIINLVRMTYGFDIPNGDNLQSGFDSVLTLSPQQFFTVTVMMLLVSKYFMQERSSEKPESKKKGRKWNKQLIKQDSLFTLCQEEYGSASPRSLKTCIDLLNEDSNLLSDLEIIMLVKEGNILVHKLEGSLGDPNRGVAIRRKLYQEKLMCESQKIALTHIPNTHYNFIKATAACCENTIGYVPIPVGLAGPLLMNNEEYYVPMATTEGTLVASTNRGMKAVYQSGGVETTIYDDGMTRAPVVEFPSAREACTMASWLQEQYNFNLVKEKFDETSRYARLKEIYARPCGRQLFIRFKAVTGDAMGMNMVSKGAEHALKWLQEIHKTMKIISLSGNFCTDKKPSAINWLLGRGKSVVAEAKIPSSVVQKILKTDIDTLVHLSFSKNQIGSAMSGSIGGFNAHAANAVTAVFIATGQDPAQNVESSNCITVLEKINNSSEGLTDGKCGDHEDKLLISCTMPCIEVATAGGGTALDVQRACLNVLFKEEHNSLHQKKPGHHARKLAHIVCATVLCSELSLLAALNAGHLVQSHMKHNRLPNQASNLSIDHNIL